MKEKKEDIKNKKIIKKDFAPPPLKKSKRVQTGIPGFDELVGGGFPQGASILISGGPGTGKTIFAMEYLINGAIHFNEKGLYLTFEQRESDLKKQALQFGWKLKELEKKGLIKIISIPVKNISKKTIYEVEEIVKKEGIKRLVIDSLSTLIVNAPIYTNPSEFSVEDAVGENVILSPPVIGDYFVRRFVYGFIEGLRGLNSTNILIGEASPNGEGITRDSLSEFACDGIISISFESLGGEFSRSLIVRKMRMTKNNEDVHPMEIGMKGIVVHEMA